MEVRKWYMKETIKNGWSHDVLEDQIKYRLYERQAIADKISNFKPTDAGQLNFYLSAIDDMLRKEGDNPTIGIILCKERDKLTAEYALKDINKPVGVSEYKLLQDIPEYLQSQLPKAEDIELHIKDIDELESEEDSD